MSAKASSATNAYSSGSSTAPPTGDGLDLLRRVSKGRRDVARYLGLPSYRGDQLCEWVFDKGVTDPDAMTNLPKDLRPRLPDLLGPLSPPILERSAGEDAEKLLVGIAQGDAVECVAMQRPWGLSACVSSQLGCAVGCRFCASGRSGLERNLAAEEIAGQVMAIAVDRETPRHVVFMGMGEPLLNLDGVLGALALLCDGHAYRIPEKNVTLSTVGWARGIDRLAASGRRVRLALSVHAGDPDLRAELIPHEPDPLPVALEAARRYEEATGRRITYEYALLEGVNDGTDQALGLARVLGAGAHVNLIDVNPVEGAGFVPASRGARRRFEEVLTSRGVNVTARRSVGGSADAACGQLRARWVRRNGMR
jgi:23S rRNA (adenine2503-C2)-methyltransferase